MRIIILGGFLGSGKTTTLLSLAKHLNIQKPQNRKIATVILENEIGEIGVDDQQLSDGDYKVSTIFSGCICCTMASELIQCINTVTQKYSPQNILIESTGLAYPDRIAEQILKYAGGCTTLLTLVLADAERWDENMETLDGLLSRQLRGGNSVLLNKIDCVKPEDQARIKDEIKALHPEAQVFLVNARRGIADEQWDEILKDWQVS